MFHDIYETARTESRAGLARYPVRMGVHMCTRGGGGGVLIYSRNVFNTEYFRTEAVFLTMHCFYPNHIFTDQYFLNNQVFYQLFY